MYENLDESILASTSKILWNKRGEHIYLVWKEFGIVGTYMDWLHERILYRPPINGPTRPSEWTLFKYPMGRMEQYSPLVRDIYTLLNQWMLGWYLQDPTFMDVVMSTLQLLLEEPHEEEYDDGHETPEAFFTPPEAFHAKLCNFLIDYIIKYAPHRQLLYFDGTLDWHQDDSSPAVPRTPRKIPNGFGSFADTPRSSPRRAMSASCSGSDTRSVNGETPDLCVYPTVFMAELQNAQRGTLLVAQLPEHVREHYPGQVRVYLPSLPYVLPQAPTMLRFTLYGVEEEPILEAPRTVVSLIELQDPAREPFFEAVYAEGKGYNDPPLALLGREARWSGGSGGCQQKCW
ncbi:hypothetical protein PMIN02_003973 [Paraphaeosphaeria minitans]